MAIDFKTFTTVAPIIAQARHPIMIRGGHGKGKSQVVYAMADKLEAIDGISRIVVERRASQMTEGDLLGLPDPDGRKINGERATTFCPPDWFVQACTEPCILFLDEVDRATLEVRQGIFELCDSRKIAGHVLHQDTVIFAAVNGGEHDSAAQYQVNEMDPAELDRWTVYDVEPTVEDWLTWAKDCPEISEIVYDFINNERKHLEHNGEFEPNKVYPSRRSWHRFAATMHQANLLADGGKENLAMIYNLGCGFVGFEAAVSFRDFVEKYECQVTVEDMLNGKFEKMATWEINDYVALVDKLEGSEKLKTELTEDQLENIAKFFKMCPSECAMKLWGVVSGAAADNSDVIIKIHSMCQDHLVTILGAEGNE